ncbi:MAG: TetR/AcrR family transcriptional regulator [Planctomycetota bacterium]
MTTKGRPREFDEQETLRRVTDTFWREGYAGASFEQLVTDSGLSRSSLYNAFGGKDELFEKALRYYVEQQIDTFLTGLASEDAPGIDDLIESWKESYSAGMPGCMFANLMLENAARRGDVRAQSYVKRTLGRIWVGMSSAFALRRRRSRERLTEQEAGAMLMAIQFGMMVISRNGKNKRIVEAIAEGAKKTF